ncbi:unnamed protein product [Heligmosomoides polygyrus]|uniref:CLASP_N domain-containing protein n=1 Tax=Heligmosomoides polygyrus TaxID=6339 RepID=A0A183F849_HELPZ|nr:unnamed protein product [Heligmosomoides polygyrus]
MTAVPVLRSTYVPVKVTRYYDDIFRWCLCRILIKKAPKVIVGLIRAASLLGTRKDVVESLLSGDNDLHQSIIKAFDACNQASETFGDETIILTPLVVLKLPHRTALKPSPMSLDLQQDHLVTGLSD